MAVVSIGAFAAARIASNSAEPQEVAVIDQEEPEVSEAPKDSQSAEETEGSEGEDSQPVEEAEEEVSYSYIFSNMPVAAYEITGLGVGRFESVNEEEIYVDALFGDGGFYYDDPFVRLTPGENTFVLFCTYLMYEVNEEGYYSRISDITTIHSPSGSSQWEAIEYQCLLGLYYTFGDYSALYRMDANTYGYNEETYGGRINSVFFADDKKAKFDEIYHPDSPQNDAIYVVELKTYPDQVGYEDIDTVLAALINTFELHGATSVKEIPVEEALERCNVVVSEGDAD